MRWDQLFADLEAQSDALAVRERAGEVDELARAELSRVAMVDRLLPSVGTTVAVRTAGDVRVLGVVARVGPTWLLVDEGSGREAVIALAHVLTVSGLGRLSAAPDARSRVGSRLGLASVLRAVARDRSGVRLHLSDGSAVEGTVDRVGADHLEVAAHGIGELRRRTEVREVNVVPFTALSVLRRQV